MIERKIIVTLGPRVLKTGLSVTLALYICSFFQLENFVFAGVAAIFTMQPSIYQTWKQMSDQVKTNILGAALALFCLHFLGNGPIIFGLVIVLVILISLKLKIEGTIPLTSVTVLAIMSVPMDEDIVFTIQRFIIILIGVFSAFLINLLVFPPKYKKNFYEKAKSVFNDLSLLLRTSVSDELTETSYREHFEKVNDGMLKLEDFYHLFNEERAKMKKMKPVDVRELVIFKQMLHTMRSGIIILETIDEHFFQSRQDEENNHLFDEKLEQLTKYHEHLLLKFEGKIKDSEQQAFDLIESQLFLNKVMEIDHETDEKKLRLVVIGSSIFEYAFQLQRLDQIIEQYRSKA